MFDTFHYAIFGHGRDPKVRSYRRDRLMMTGVDVPPIFPCDAEQLCIRADVYCMNRSGAIALGLPMDISVFEMLDESAAVKDVQQLKSAADCKHRHIAFDSFRKKMHFDSVARLIRCLRFRVGLFSIKGGTYVHPAGEQQTIAAVESNRFPNVHQNRNEACGTYGRFVWRHSGWFVIRNQHSL